jgi:viologen exporter family transport system permease protein
VTFPSTRIHLALAGSALRGALQYRANLFIMVVAGLCWQGVGLAFVSTIVLRFGSLGGWHLPELAFLYAIRLTAHGLYLVPFGNLYQADLVIRDGEFDRFLVRPANPLVQLLTRQVRLSAFGDLAGGLALLVATALVVPVSWSPLHLLYLVAALVGGALVEAAGQLGVASLAFRLRDTFQLRLAIDQIFAGFGNYPLKIFGQAARTAFTFVIPLAFIAYLPATVLLDRTGELSVPRLLAIAAPLAGVLLFAAAYRLWVHATRSYTSNGT